MDKLDYFADFDPEMLEIVDAMKRDLFPDPAFGVGRIVGDIGGYKVRIVAGMYWDGEGPERRLSNHWTWHPVNDAGERTGPDTGGYGWELFDPRLN